MNAVKVKETMNLFKPMKSSTAVVWDLKRVSEGSMMTFKYSFRKSVVLKTGISF